MLPDLQREFAAAVFDGSPAAARRVRTGRFAADQHLQIYRRNIITTLTAALGDVYPVVEKLVGTGFFAFAAHEYLRDHRPLSASLHDFGGAFAGFLAGFAPAASLPYLADVARLEWAWHRAFHAADAPPFDPASLPAVGNGDPVRWRVLLHPSAQLVSSDFPIVRIFEVNQDGYDGDLAVDLGAGGVTALVMRRGLAVCVEPLTTGDAALLTSFLQNRPLGEALEAALAAQPDFDLSTALAAQVRRGTIVRVLPD